MFKKKAAYYVRLSLGGSEMCLRDSYCLRRLHQVLIARLTAGPVYDLKMAFSLHAHILAEHVAAIRARVGEMREPPLGLDKVPHAALQVFFDELRQAPTTEALLVGVFELAPVAYNHLTLPTNR